MKYIELFAGCGVFSQAVKELGLDWECVGYSEIDKYAIKVYQKHFPKHKNLGDITIINPLELPEFDFIVGGSPCQDISIAGKGEGMEGKRSRLFFNMLQIINVWRPKYFLLENVNSMRKSVKETISQLMGVEPVMIDAALVSAQSRKRLFWCNWKVEQPQDRGILLKDILENGFTDRDKGRNVSESAGRITEREYFKKHQGNMVYEHTQQRNHQSSKRRINVNPSGKGMNGNVYDPRYKSPNLTTNKGEGIKILDRLNRIGDIGGKGQGQRVYSAEGKSVTLSSNGGGQGAKTGLYHVPHGYIKEKIEETDKYPTLHSQDPGNNHLLVEDYVIRKLTPVECERLQSLPDGFTSGVSKTQRYIMLGNAFNCEVIKHILKEFVINLERDKKNG